MNRLDFAWVAHKDYACLKPLYDHFVALGWQCNMVKINRHKLRNTFKINKLAPHIVVAYDIPIRRLLRHQWDGKFIYIDHGVGPIKYYAYRYKYFHSAALLFYQGDVFRRKMEAVNPGFKNGLLGGFVKMDELVRLKVDRIALCKKYGLNADEPIILFAPTWGGKKSNHWGIRNVVYLQDVPNLIIAPHSSDYQYAKKFNAVLPDEKSNINILIKLADVIVSDISSIVGEAAAIQKPTIQIEMPSYPGSFPEPDGRPQIDNWLSDEIIEHEMKVTDRSERPFKIPYLDEDWIVDRTSKPEYLSQVIEEAFREPDKNEEQRRYWGEQCCWKADGQTCKRTADMIIEYLNTGNRIQLNA